LLVKDTTFEALHEILRDNPAGVLCVRDELSGWMSELDKAGRESDRAFWLECWNGCNPFTVDRIGRGLVHAPMVCVSLLGNLQPSRLRSYLSDTLTGGPGDDGLAQRFQILIWPDLDLDWKDVDRKPDQEAIRRAQKVFTRLANLSADRPIQLRFSEDAQELFSAWRQVLEDKVRGEHGLHPAFIGHLAKYRSLLPSLAGLFELADLAAGDNELAVEALISLNHIQQAAAYCKYLESHAARVYASMVSPEMTAARELGRHIEAGDLAETFTTRDVYRRGWSGLTQPEQARNALELLGDSGWVAERKPSPGSSGGRPTEEWQINPKVKRHGN
jgi:putative DNA primase/helicase